MADNTSEFPKVMGEAFNLKRHNDDKTNFAVKSYQTGGITNWTLWDSSHGHIELKQGDFVVLTGKKTVTPKKDGDGHWVNYSVKRIGVVPMDSGIDTRSESARETVPASDPDLDIM